jgi:hypothetical protein
VKRLKESGLMDLGATSLSIFWEQIVNPTWVQGSTTQVGYKKVIEDRIKAILYQNKSIVPSMKISDAASLFVDSYLRHSRIDNRWQPVLDKLNVHPSVRAVVATDHYAEATGYILQFLEELHIQAVSAKAAMNARRSKSVIVANSADLGFHKDNTRFWEILKNGLHMGGVRHVLLVDDFGCNEQKDDSYSVPEKVEQRRLDTVKLLQEVFSAKVQAIPFIIKDEKNEKAFSDLIIGTSAMIDRYLATLDDGD